MTALGRVDTAAGPYSVRRARAHDVPALVALLAADAVAAARGDGVDDLAPYERAFRWAIEWARDQGCGLVQLTTDATRHRRAPVLRPARLRADPPRLQAPARGVRVGACPMIISTGGRSRRPST